MTVDQGQTGDRNATRKGGPSGYTPAGGGRTGGGGLGMRRIECVRLVFDGETSRAEVVGVGFRLPVSRPVPLGLAGRLIASGTPHLTLVEHRDQ
jgi:hypothetical protein